MCWDFRSVPKSYKKDLSILNHDEQSQEADLSESEPVDWNVLLCKKNVEEYLGYSYLKFSRVVSPPPWTRKDSCNVSLGGGTRRDSSSLSFGGGSSKCRPSREAEGSSSRSDSKRRRISPLFLLITRKRRLMMKFL